MKKRLPEIRLSGPLDNLLWMMQVVKTVTSTRNVAGWYLFQDDEEWKYITMEDGNVCRTCLSFAGDMRGPEIPVLFGKFWSRTGQNTVYPNTHEAYPAKTRGDCRCTLEWSDYLFTLLMRLDDELRNKIVSSLQAAGFVRQ